MDQGVEELKQKGKPTTEILELFPSQGDWTEIDYFNLPDKNYLIELSEGRLAILDMPTHSHQRAVTRLLRAMSAFVEDNRLGEMSIAPLPVRLWQGKIREPDIIFMAEAHRDRITEEYWGVPDLVVEVISRSTAQIDRVDKFVEYAKAGIQEYWLVDVAIQTVEVFKLQAGAYMMLGKWSVGEIARSEILPGFKIEVAVVVGD